MQGIAVIARLKPGTEAQVEALLAEGPPFDPHDLGFERHSVFLTSDEVVFVFEGVHAGAMVLQASRQLDAGVLGAWEPLIEGLPKIARGAYAWTRREAAAWSGGWGE